MIRRDISGDRWLLIEQVEHARLAAEIAAVWGNNIIPPLPLQDLLVFAIRHHDDGWKQWAAAPNIDPQTHRPRDFTEMRMPDATSVWERSIKTCHKQDPLAGIWVSRHFCWLAEKARTSRERQRPEPDPAELVAIEEFLDRQTQQQAHWKAEAIAQTGGRKPSDGDSVEQLSETGFRFVQFFDSLSLWLCCRPVAKPREMDVPGNGSVRWTPHVGGAAEVTEIEVQPFPLAVDRLELSVFGRRVPARNYAADADLQAVLKTSAVAQLRYAIVP